MKRRQAPQPPKPEMQGLTLEDEIRINSLLAMDSEEENEEISTRSPIMQTFATAAHKRKSVLLSRIHDTLEFLPSKDLSYVSCQMATESMELSRKDTEINPTSLLSEIRSLPTNMNEKRQYKNQLLQVRNIITVTSETSVIETIRQWIKMRFPDIWKEIKSKMEWETTSLTAIEGQFGTGVVSYFVFLRWLILLNVLLFFVMLLYIVMPQAAFPTASSDPSKYQITVPPALSVNSTEAGFPENGTYPTGWEPLRLFDIGITKPSLSFGSLFDDLIKEGFMDTTLRYTTENMTPNELYILSQLCQNRYLASLNNATSSSFLINVQDFFQGTGWMENTLLFMGYYKPFDVQLGLGKYAVPVAYLSVLFVLVFLNLVMMMLYASKGLQEMMLKNVSEQYCCVVFCGWDFCIVNEKTAERQHNNVYYEAKSSLSEGRRKAEISNWSSEYKTKVFAIRVCAYIATVLMVIGAYFLLFHVTDAQMKAETVGPREGLKAMLVKFSPSITLTALNFTIPFILSYLIVFEEYRFQTEINIFLLRVVFVRLSSIIIIVYTFYYQIICEPQDKCSKGMETCASPLCWETYVGQQMYRLVVMDFFVHVSVSLFWELPRRLIQNKWVKTVMFLGNRVFDIPTQVLSLVYSQTLCWLGMFFCPLLPFVSLTKLVIFFYMKKYSLLKNCVPHKVPYKASRSNAVFIVVLMLSFFIAISILGFSVTNIKPSPSCGPFQYNEKNMVHSVYTDIVKKAPGLGKFLAFVFSALFLIPLIILLCLILYYYITKTSAHKKMVKLLKMQLTMEGKDKLFLLARVTTVHKAANNPDSRERSRTQSMGELSWSKNH